MERVYAVGDLVFATTKEGVWPAQVSSHNSIDRQNLHQFFLSWRFSKFREAVSLSSFSQRMEHQVSERSSRTTKKTRSALAIIKACWTRRVFERQWSWLENPLETFRPGSPTLRRSTKTSSHPPKSRSIRSNQNRAKLRILLMKLMKMNNWISTTKATVSCFCNHCE